jgi:hypothetical protein
MTLVEWYRIQVVDHKLRVNPTVLRNPALYGCYKSYDEALAAINLVAHERGLSDRWEYQIVKTYARAYDEHEIDFGPA